jgi:DNA polymerase-3 subunit alpha
MVDSKKTDRDTLQRVQQTLKRYPGSCKGFVHICIDGQAEAVISMTEDLRIRYCDAMTREINAILGYACVQSRCSDAASAMRTNGAEGRRRNGRQFARG